jgi:hypothetical protein
MDIPGMETLASLLVGKPQNILVVAIAFLVGYLVPRFTALGNRRRFGLLLIASVAWGVYAAWEWLVQAKTPEANIRVDLLVIWPMLAILSTWALYRVLRSY